MYYYREGLFQYDWNSFGYIISWIESGILASELLRSTVTLRKIGSLEKSLLDSHPAWISQLSLTYLIIVLYWRRICHQIFVLRIHRYIRNWELTKMTLFRVCKWACLSPRYLSHLLQTQQTCRIQGIAPTRWSDFDLIYLDLLV